MKMYVVLGFLPHWTGPIPYSPPCDLGAAQTRLAALRQGVAHWASPIRFFLAEVEVVQDDLPLAPALSQITGTPALVPEEQAA